MKDKIAQTLTLMYRGPYCRTRAQLIISDHLIIISDDKLGPHSGIIIGLIRPAGRPAGRPTTRWNSLKLNFFPLVSNPNLFFQK